MYLQGRSQDFRNGGGGGGGGPRITSERENFGTEVTPTK